MKREILIIASLILLTFGQTTGNTTTEPSNEQTIEMIIEIIFAFISAFIILTCFYFIYIKYCKTNNNRNQYMYI